MKLGGTDKGDKKQNPLDGLTHADRQRYLTAARKRQNRRKLQSIGLKLKKQDRKGRRASHPTHKRRVITENWLENREWEEEKNKPVREIPAWLFPLIILIVLVSALFVILPMAISRYVRSQADTSNANPTVIETVYSDNMMVARKPAVDVFLEANIQSERITQLLYNEVVERLSPKGSFAEFYKVRLADGRIAFCRQVDLEEDTSSVEPDDSIARLIVTDLSKRVMSHASNGNLVLEVKMNTELFVTYHSDPLYRVKLPGGGEGWLDSTGVLELEVDQDVDVAGSMYFTDSIMAFNYATLMPHGVTNEGISVPAAVSIAASVNGLEVPEDIMGIRSLSKPVSGALTETGALNYNAFQRGDLLFFSDAEGGEASRLVVWVDYGIVLADRPREFVIRETDINTILQESNFVGAGRLFDY